MERSIKSSKGSSDELDNSQKAGNVTRMADFETKRAGIAPYVIDPEKKTADERDLLNFKVVPLNVFLARRAEVERKKQQTQGAEQEKSRITPETHPHTFAAHKRKKGAAFLGEHSQKTKQTPQADQGLDRAVGEN